MSECKVAVLTEAQLREIVGDAVRAALREVAQLKGDEPRWYDTKAAAKYLGITPAALQKQVERGHIKPDNRHVGRVSGFRFRRDTLERFQLGG
ncbi:MAG: hypothetical protein RLZZ450_7651 [Pseudomonadota bacterium]|jgi:hypothetical protein